jgi:GT2 family glycosyltransferase/glycosyltransferase involved in cell wall biosynthesis
LPKGKDPRIVARALTLARALRDRGHSVTFIVPQTDLRPAQPAAATLWQAEGFPTIPVAAGHLPPDLERFPRDPWLVTARALATLLLPFDAAWFFDLEWAMPLARHRRFSPNPIPLIIADGLPLPDRLPTSLDETNRIFARNYTLRWADLTVPQNADSLETIPHLDSLWHHRKAAPQDDPQQSDSASAVACSSPSSSTLSLPKGKAPRIVACTPHATTSPAVTVCIAYFEEPTFLPEALLSLEHQTSTDFTVVVVDDGSPSPTARAAFDACAARYTHRGWTFLRQTNQYAGAAKNRAAREASTDFLLFLDADDIAMPNMVERFLQAALLSGDDCLVAPNYGFRDDPNGPCLQLYDPPGNNLIGSMGDDMHGAGCIFIRRSAFHQLGGFTTLRGLSFDDYELHIRANLAGLRWDVLPDFVYRYRMPRAHGVSRSTSAYNNLARVTRWYKALLDPIPTNPRVPHSSQPHRDEWETEAPDAPAVQSTQPSLNQLPLAFASAYWSLEHANDRLRDLNRTLTHRRARRSPQGRELKLLLLTCNFPYELSSGWHNRVQQLIRYFGARYQLTLMTSMPREQLAPFRQQTFRHLHAVLGVEGSNTPAPTAPDTPFRVREHYTDTFQSALRSLPTDQYHAAILDQIFMAEFRHDLDTLPVLTEHNIESTLLRQAAQSPWNHQPDDTLPLHYRNARAESTLLALYEDHAWPDFPLRAAVSDLDRLTIDRRLQQAGTPQGKTVVAPNGADPSTWLPNLRFRAATVLFTGHLAYLPNVDAIDYLLTQIWPLVHARAPHARLLIAGRDPSPTGLAAVARATASTTYASRPHIELCINPPSMAAIAARASLSIAPLRLGSGTRLKILDSLAWGLPVVSTTLGAEGLAVIDETHLLLRDAPQPFAEAILRLLTDHPLWQSLRSNGAALIRDRYAWDHVFTPLEDALLELIP